MWTGFHPVSAGREGADWKLHHLVEREGDYGFTCAFTRLINIYIYIILKQERTNLTSAMVMSSLLYCRVVPANVWHTDIPNLDSSAANSLVKSPLGRPIFVKLLLHTWSQNSKWARQQAAVCRSSVSFRPAWPCRFYVRYVKTVLDVQEKLLLIQQPLATLGNVQAELNNERRSVHSGALLFSSAEPASQSTNAAGSAGSCVNNCGFDKLPAIWTGCASTSFKARLS